MNSSNKRIVDSVKRRVKEKSINSHYHVNELLLQCNLTVEQMMVFEEYLRDIDNEKASENFAKNIKYLDKNIRRKIIGYAKKHNLPIDNQLRFRSKREVY